MMQDLAFCWSTLACALVVGLISTATDVARAACNVELSVRKYSEPKEARGRIDFQPNDQFVLCFRLPEDAYVSVWDAPPRNAGVSRIYPNIFTHQQSNATVRAERLVGGREYCFGTPETFPLFFPKDQGAGSGKLSIHVTKSIDDQPALNDYEIPGQRLLRARSIAVEEIANDNSCRKSTAYVPYRIGR